MCQPVDFAKSRERRPEQRNSRDSEESGLEAQFGYLRGVELLHPCSERLAGVALSTVDIPHSAKLFVIAENRQSEFSFRMLTGALGSSIETH
jgi:hypothetical protein